MTQFSRNTALEPQVEQLDSLRARREAVAEAVAEARLIGSIPTDPLCNNLIDQLSLCIEMRRLRKSHFGPIALTGPTWDMMLDLMLAVSRDRDLSASDLATGANVPLSSGLRMIATLEQANLVRRFIDERDRRRTLVRLTDHGFERMASYFERLRFERHRSGRTAA
ncbi:MarR family winged helix-turn-helix transcriptional regulator [Sphingopyxis sp. MWB1]|uniref:MarR family winged helix-turn-helix transcriptional regulator n=1 Tax=Sphingopyxis sp. MWB1 TaxID=1537715 RepID=UPI00051A3102|nr:winged helix DNA-binding protein [Sphingopyxis sp. MWB1]